MSSAVISWYRNDNTTEIGLPEKVLWEFSMMGKGITMKYSWLWVTGLLQALENRVSDPSQNQNSISGWNKTMACNFSKQLRQLMSQSGPIPRDGNMPSSDESQMKYKKTTGNRVPQLHKWLKESNRQEKPSQMMKTSTPNHPKAARFLQH